jgi:hypothetical protein
VAGNFSRKLNGFESRFFGVKKTAEQAVFLYVLTLLQQNMRLIKQPREG